MKLLSLLLFFSFGIAQAQSIFYSKASLTTLKNENVLIRYEGAQYPISADSDVKGLKIKYAFNADTDAETTDEISEIVSEDRPAYVYAVRIDKDGKAQKPAPTLKTIKEIRYSTQTRTFN